MGVVVRTAGATGFGATKGIGEIGANGGVGGTTTPGGMKFGFCSILGSGIVGAGGTTGCGGGGGRGESIFCISSGLEGIVLIPDEGVAVNTGTGEDVSFVLLEPCGRLLEVFCGGIPLSEYNRTPSLLLGWLRRSLWWVSSFFCDKKKSATTHAGRCAPRPYEKRATSSGLTESAVFPRNPGNLTRRTAAQLLRGSNSTTCPLV